MGAYIVRRLLLMIPTLLAIMVINFVIIQKIGRASGRERV